MQIVYLLRISIDGSLQMKHFAPTQAGRRSFARRQRHAERLGDSGNSGSAAVARGERQQQLALFHGHERTQPCR